MLHILERDFRKISPNGQKRHALYVFCDEYNRYNWIQESRYEDGTAVNGRLFPCKSFYECKSEQEFISQYPIHKKTSKGYQYIANNGKRELLHKFLVESVINEPLNKPFTVDHIDTNITNNSLSNLQILFQWEQVEKSSKFKNGYSFTKSKKSYCSSFLGKVSKAFSTPEEALNARELAKTQWKLDNEDLVLKQSYYNNLILAVSNKSS